MKLALWPTQLALGVEPPTRHVDRQNVASSAEVSRARAEKAPLQRGVTLGVAEAVGGPVLDGVAEPVGVPVMVELAVPVTVLEEVAVRVWLPDWVVLPVCVEVGVLVAVEVLELENVLEAVRVCVVVPVAVDELVHVAVLVPDELMERVLVPLIELVPVWLAVPVAVDELVPVGVTVPVGVNDAAAASPTSRTRKLYRSATATSRLVGETATPDGPFSVAAVPAPPSPENDALPATPASKSIVSTPRRDECHGVTTRMIELPASATYTRSHASTLTPCGERRLASVAGPPSPA